MHNTMSDASHRSDQGCSVKYFHVYQSKYSKLRTKMIKNQNETLGKMYKVHETESDEIISIPAYVEDAHRRYEWVQCLSLEPP